MSTAPEDYCRARRRGASFDEASAEAGYSGPAGASARRLWERVEMLLTDMATCPTEDALQRSIADKRARIARLKTMMQDDVDWLRAVRFVRGETS